MKQLDKQICAGTATFEPTDIALTFIFIQTVCVEITFDWNMMREASALQYGAFHMQNLCGYMMYRRKT